MEKIGCTSPYGLNISNVCNGRNKSSEALSLFEAITSNDKNVDQCPIPCSFISSSFTPMDSFETQNNDSIFLKFDKFIKVTKANYFYNFLELMAELGGYTGLFWGLSLFDVRKGFDFLMKKWNERAMRRWLVLDNHAHIV